MTAPEQGAAGLDIAAYLPCWTAPPTETDLPDVAGLIGDLHPETDRALKETELTANTTTERPRKPAGELTTDDAIWSGGCAARVTGVFPYANGARVLVVSDDGEDVDADRHDADELLPLATADEIAKADADARRAAVVAQIRALGDLLESRTDLPVPASVVANISVDGPHPYSTVAAVAERLSVPFEQVTENTRQATYELLGPALVTYTVSAYVPASTKAGA